MLRYWTAGESHGRALVALVDGFPARVPLDAEQINGDLRRRQGGYGRGGRQRIEADRVEILSGLWRGQSMGSPLALQVANRDDKLERMEDIMRPRPGHGDLAGAIKYLGPIRPILERASARETAARVAVGSLAKQLLACFDIRVMGYVVELGGIPLSAPVASWEERLQLRDASAVYSLAPDQDEAVKQLIQQTGKAGDTLGGVVEVMVERPPFGLGTHTQWDRKLDGRLAQAVMSIQAIKGVEFGLGFEAARRPGSQVHDPIGYEASEVAGPTLGYTRASNHAGGLEAGMTNGQPIVVRAAMKPISTLRTALPSVNLESKQGELAEYERSDVCAVSAASVVVECVVAFEIARALVEKFGNDTLEEMRDRWILFHERARER
jgi:chorismate synthase